VEVARLTDDQWAGFIDAAIRRVERLLNAYDILRQHIAPAVRAAIEPRRAGEIGLAFSGTRRSFFAVGFFRRDPATLPRIYFDPSVGDFNPERRAIGKIPMRSMGSRRGQEGFWFLRSPERYAATLMKAELERVAKEGMLVEEAEVLLEERVVALTIAHASELKFKQHPARRVTRFADHFIGVELFPLDLKALRKTLQIELGFRMHQDEHMQLRHTDELKKLQSAGVAADIMSYSSNWTQADLDAWRARVVKQVDAGEDFTARSTRSDEVTLLARDVNTLLKSKQTLNTPLLPAPDVPSNDPLSGVHNFEDGYTDDQLAHLLETIYDRSLQAYDRLVSDSFSEELGSLLQQPPSPLGILCFRLPVKKRVTSQFGASLESGLASPIDSEMLDGKRAIAVTVHPRGTTRLERVARDGWFPDTIVHTQSGRFSVAVRRHFGLVSVVCPWDAPAFTPTGSKSAAGFAPVRAMMYQYAREALKELSVSQLSDLAIRPRA